MKSFSIFLLFAIACLASASFLGLGKDEATENDEEEVHNREKREAFSYFQCPPGPEGPPGVQGPAGLNGLNGRDGRDTVCCKPPVPITKKPNTDASSVYTRWGRNDCPDTAWLVYNGTIGGPRNDQRGSGSNYLCLPGAPVFDLPVPQIDTNRANVWRGIYQTSDFPPLSDVHDQVALCAICLAEGRDTQLMIPATTECPSSEWTLEYSGYLMAERNDNFRTEYICVDRNATGVATANQDGAFLFPTEARCMPASSIPCDGQYVDGNELTCAVCTLRDEVKVPPTTTVLPPPEAPGLG